MTTPHARGHCRPPPALPSAHASHAADCLHLLWGHLQHSSVQQFTTLTADTLNGRAILIQIRKTYAIDNAAKHALVLGAVLFHYEATMKPTDCWKPPRSCGGASSTA